MKSVVHMPTHLSGEVQPDSAPVVDQQPLARAAVPRPHSAFVPVLLCVLALLAGLGWQTYLLFSERSALLSAHAGQQALVDNASKLRSSLDGLAADTQRLADGGNASAALLVTELKKRGITIDPKAAAAAAPAVTR